jgi:hypothetical protein
MNNLILFCNDKKFKNKIYKLAYFDSIVFEAITICILANYLKLLSSSFINVSSVL